MGADEAGRAGVNVERGVAAETEGAFDEPFTLVFVGHAEATASDRASAYEDRVLPLLADHGAHLLFRGRRVGGADPSLPLEVHVIRFSHRRALAAYLADERRQALLDEYGEVFTRTEVVEVDTITGPG